jgi:hypothetical protein
MTRLFALLTCFVLMTACASNVQDQPPASLGEFKLGHNVVIADKAQQGPISRDATPEEWVSTLTSAVDRRFGGFEGSQLYHIGMSVEGYMLGPPGFIYNPRSMLILNVTVWDDAAGKKLNEKVHQIQVLEDTTGETAFVGSGRVRTKEQQMDGLAANAMDRLGEWLVEMNETNGWFAKRPDAEIAPSDPVAPAG